MPICDCGCCATGCRHCDAGCTSRETATTEDDGLPADYWLTRAPRQAA